MSEKATGDSRLATEPPCPHSRDGAFAAPCQTVRCPGCDLALCRLDFVGQRHMEDNHPGIIAARLGRPAASSQPPVAFS